jgi:hypothetical protein
MTVLLVQDDTPRYKNYPDTLTSIVVGQRVYVYDRFGLAAVFTPGARTVRIRGQQRTFQENFRGGTDPFDRTVSNGWGQSPYTGTWGNFGGANSNYGVTPGIATHTPSAEATSYYTRLGITADGLRAADARMKVTWSATPVGASYTSALLLGWQNTTNHYRLRLTFGTTGTVVATIALATTASGETILQTAGTIGTGFVGNQNWWIRGTIANGTINMYAWKDGDAEPVTPTVTATNSTFTTGDVGVRSFVTSGGTIGPQARVSSYSVTGDFAVSETFTTSWWARTYPQNFESFDAEAAEWTSRALVDYSPDLLAYMFGFFTNAPAITSPRYDGKQVLGQSDYGPLDATGGKVEGSDWYDYIGTQWVASASEGGFTRNPQASQLHKLDCSGGVRMVMGFWGGLPMTLSELEFMNGINIPRTSRDMTYYNPGVVLSRTINYPADYSQALPMDLVSMDATNGGEEQANEPDHIGFFLGVGSLGNILFASPRKTANAFTMSALGGSSILNGAGLYATTFRQLATW